MYRVTYSKKARKYLLKMPKQWQKRVVEKVELLAENPYSTNNNATKLVGREGYRLRIGDFRIIYNILNDVLIIEVVDIGPRGGIYQ